MKNGDGVTVTVAGEAEGVGAVRAEVLSEPLIEAEAAAEGSVLGVEPVA